uniref:Uncharacterized protein n=1 Tax=Amphimedon queenslandica TaxID=400682 RepID=A0A1X7VHM1_AMPQE
LVLRLVLILLVIRIVDIPSACQFNAVSHK